MLRQSLVQNTELKDRLSQIHALAAGLETSHVHVPTSSLKNPRPRTPASLTQSFTGSIGNNLPRYGGGAGKSLTRFDSFVSVRSTLSETFFDALDDVSL